MPSTPDLKLALRRQLRQRRRDIDATSRLRAAERIAAILEDLPGLREARHIATYIAADAEIDPDVANRSLRKLGKDIYLPVIRPGNQLEFARWQLNDALVPNKLGIPEPPPAAERRAAQALDLVLLPLVGWSPGGTRLGMGGGFYDRSLGNAPGLTKVGLAFEVQRMDSLPEEQWDVRMDFVVTESALHDCRDGVH